MNGRVEKYLLGSAALSLICNENQYLMIDDIKCAPSSQVTRKAVATPHQSVSTQNSLVKCMHYIIRKIS